MNSYDQNSEHDETTNIEKGQDVFPVEVFDDEHNQYVHKDTI